MKYAIVYAPEKIHSLVPNYCNYGYAIMVYVGKELFTKYRMIYDVKQTLDDKNISISYSKISYSCCQICSLPINCPQRKYR